MGMEIQHSEIILFVADQAASTRFYEDLLQRKADLNVPGMTEFHISATLKLGLMPNTGIAKIIRNNLPHPETGIGIPRCELYFTVPDPEAAYQQALSVGAKAVSPVQPRNWGHIAGYVADADGHVIAFAGVE